MKIIKKKETNMNNEYPDYRLGGYGRIDQDEFFESQRTRYDDFLEISGTSIAFIVVVYGLCKLIGWL